MKKYKNLIVGFILFVICLASCVSQLSESIRLDEAQQIWASTKSVSGILSYVGQDVHVPLYGLILHFWIQIFGTSIISARIPSLLFFLLTLPTLYILYKETSNKIVALVAVGGFALSPFILWYGTETRMYSLLTFIVSINTIFFLRIVRTKGQEGKFGYFLSAIFGLYTHYFFLLSLFTQGVFVLVRWIYFWYKNKTRHNRTTALLTTINKKICITTIALMTGAFLFFIPWLWYVVKLGEVGNTQPLIAPPSTFNIFQSFINFVFGFQPQPTQSAIISFWPLMVIILFFVFTQKKVLRIKNIEFFLLSVLLPIITVYLISFIRPIFLSRYLIFTIPFLFFLIAWSLLNYTNKLKKIIITGFFIILIVCEVYQNYSPATPVKENYIQVASYLTNHATASDIITVTPPFTIYPIEYSYTGDARISSIPDWDVYKIGPIPPFSQKVFKKQLQTLSQTYVYVYVVTSYDQGYQGAIVNYMEKHYYRVTKKDFSPGLEIRVYKLRYLPSA